jgi:hypothetical protein
MAELQEFLEVCDDAINGLNKAKTKNSFCFQSELSIRTEELMLFDDIDVPIANFNAQTIYNKCNKLKNVIIDILQFSCKYVSSMKDPISIEVLDYIKRKEVVDAIKDITDILE